MARRWRQWFRGWRRATSLRARLESAIGDTTDIYAQEALAKGAEDELDELRDAIGAAVKGLRAGKPAEDIAKAPEAA